MEAQAGYPKFLLDAGKILNSKQTNALVVHGNILDLFPRTEGDRKHVPLIPLMTEAWDIAGVVQIVYELNGPLNFKNDTDVARLEPLWNEWRGWTPVPMRHSDPDGKSRPESFQECLLKAVGNPTFTLEFLRQLTLCLRHGRKAKPLASIPSLIIFLEGAEMLLPPGGGDIASLPMADRQRLNIVLDWFSEPDFLGGKDSVLLITESIQSLHPKIRSLPQVMAVDVPLPGAEDRKAYVQSIIGAIPEAQTESPFWGTLEEFVDSTAGLTLHSLGQLLREWQYVRKQITVAEVVTKVERCFQMELGEDVIEFKKPEQRMSDLVGAGALRSFIQDRLIPRLSASGKELALPGFAVAGPIRGGKTFIFEAMAAELDMPIIVLKNFRSQWFGQSDVILDKLVRVLRSLRKALIFVDEADTQFGGVGKDVHETEKRLTGKLQQVMSDPAFRGKIFWVLLSARIHLLSPDMRGPGRAGGLIIPVLDPVGTDRTEFLRWMVGKALGEVPTEAQLLEIGSMLGPEMSYAGVFLALKSELAEEKAFRKKATLTLEEVKAVIHNYLPPPLEDTRRFQTLQALLNCTRKDLIPDAYLRGNLLESRKAWMEELADLEARGVQGY
jgi:hypothetical protein